MIRFSDNQREPRPELVPGEYTGELIKVEYHPTEEETRQGVVPQFGPYLTFVFKVVEPAEFANAFRSGICSAKRHPKSKLTQWLQAFGVDASTVGESLDEASLLKKRVKLKLENDNKGQLKITSVWAVGSKPPIPAGAPMGFKPASRPSPATRPTPVSLPSSSPKGQVSQSDDSLDDVPF